MEIKKYSLEQIISLDSCINSGFATFCSSKIKNIHNPFITETGEICYSIRSTSTKLFCSHPFWYKDIFNPGQLINVNGIVYEIGLFSINDRAYLTKFEPGIRGHLALRAI